MTQSKQTADHHWTPSPNLPLLSLVEVMSPTKRRSMKHSFGAGLLLSAFSVTARAAFLVGPSRTCHQSRHSSAAAPLFLSSSDDHDTKETLDFTNFNPFQQGSPTGRHHPLESSAGNANTISLRQTEMQQVMGELIEVVRQGDEAVNKVLLKHKEFILEPLEDDNAVLEIDSIYTPQMTRTERYIAYGNTMQERVDKARDPHAKRVLKSMMKFVLSYE